MSDAINCLNKSVSAESLFRLILGILNDDLVINSQIFEENVTLYGSCTNESIESLFKRCLFYDGNQLTLRLFK